MAKLQAEKRIQEIQEWTHRHLHSRGSFQSSIQEYSRFSDWKARLPRLAPACSWAMLAFLESQSHIVVLLPNASCSGLVECESPDRYEHGKALRSVDQNRQSSEAYRSVPSLGQHRLQLRQLRPPEPKKCLRKSSTDTQEACSGLNEARTSLANRSEGFARSVLSTLHPTVNAILCHPTNPLTPQANFQYH